MSPLSTRALALALPFALTLAACDSTDDDGTVAADVSVYATSNPADVTGDAVVRLSADLAATTATFGGFTGVTSVQSVAITDGDGYLTVDLLGALGGIVVVPDLCEGGGCANPGTSIGAGARLVAGPLTGLVAPKGLINVDDQLFVADNGGSGAVRVFSETATGNAAPAYVITNLGAATSVWDVAYDDRDDRLFVATTNGLVLVYDNVTTSRGAAGPTRTITPTDGTAKISVNLHGIAYDRARDILVLSDVGVAAGGAAASDGQLFTIRAARSASGNTAVAARASGAATTLGNPVDLDITSAGAVYVAEKANSRVLRYDGFVTATGAITTAPDASTAVASAESVAVVNG